MEITLVVIQLFTRLDYPTKKKKNQITNSKEQCFSTTLAFNIILCESIDILLGFST